MFHINKKDIQQRFPNLCQPRPSNAHKGTLGTVGIVGGSVGMSGAVVLSSMAALKTGCGKVFVGFNQTALPLPYLPCQPEIMLDTAENLIKRKDINAWVIGCGLGQNIQAQKILDNILFSKKFSPLLLDADALNLLAQLDEESVFRLPEKNIRILTPHPLEAARLLHCSVDDIQKNREQSAIKIAQRYQAWVVLKGENSVIAHFDGTIIVNDSGNPSLATAGSGDVLSGIIASLLAQKIPVQQAVHGGVWLHGKAGEMLAEQGLSIGATATEIINQVRLLRHQLTMSS
ncbi:MAG: NAD(P)H-hydrate dehydratase [Neisseriaceae bacterium]|nr:NAD(P)H-hydrate dehydratase [Neisseriaceae bacterium]